MNITDAFLELSKGKKIKRTAWKGLFFIGAETIISVTHPCGLAIRTEVFREDGGVKLYGWTPNDFDVFANDWEVSE